LARKPSRRQDRYCIRLSRVLTSAVGWPMSCLVRLASDRFKFDQTGSTGFSSATGSGVEEVFVFGEATGATPFACLLRATGTAPPAAGIDPATDLVALPYSSGTTGLAKGVMLTHRNLVATLVQWNAVLPTGPEDRLIAVLPFFHMYGLSLLMGWALWRGATLVSMPRFDLEEFLRVLQEQRITHALLVPPILLALAQHPLVASYDLSAWS
jgi:acyl-coenzyme A synthetase/AMP-(fatty) acid ligase